MTRDPAADRPQWQMRSSLPAAAMAALRRPIGEAVAIVSTVDADGAPRTAAFGSMRSISPTSLRFGCNRSHDTFANLVRDGRVMVAVFAPPDVAVGVRGRAHTLREQIPVWPTDAVIEIAVETVKNDFLPGAPIASGITYELSEDVAAQLDRYIAHVEAGADDPPPASA